MHEPSDAVDLSDQRGLAEHGNHAFEASPLCIAFSARNNPNRTRTTSCVFRRRKTAFYPPQNGCINLGRELPRRTVASMLAEHPDLHADPLALQ